MTPDEPTPPKPIEIKAADAVDVQEALGAHKSGPDREGFVVVEPGWNANTEIEQGKIARATSIGKPSEGEADSLACAGRFIRFIRSQGETWWEDPLFRGTVGPILDRLRSFRPTRPTAPRHAEQAPDAGPARDDRQGDVYRMG